MPSSRTNRATTRFRVSSWPHGDPGRALLIHVLSHHPSISNICPGWVERRANIVAPAHEGSSSRCGPGRPSNNAHRVRRRWFSPVVTDGSPRARDSRAVETNTSRRHPLDPLPDRLTGHAVPRTDLPQHRRRCLPQSSPVQHRLGPSLERPENTPDELRHNLRHGLTRQRCRVPRHRHTITGCGFRCSPASHAESVHDYRRT